MDSGYLIQMVGLPLQECLAEVLAKRPKDPIEWIAQWLYRYVDNQIYYRETEQQLKEHFEVEMKSILENEDRTLNLERLQVQQHRVNKTVIIEERKHDALLNMYTTTRGNLQVSQFGKLFGHSGIDDIIDFEKVKKTKTTVADQLFGDKGKSVFITVPQTRKDGETNKKEISSPKISDEIQEQENITQKKSESFNQEMVEEKHQSNTNLRISPEELLEKETSKEISDSEKIYVKIEEQVEMESIKKKSSLVDEKVQPKESLQQGSSIVDEKVQTKESLQQGSSLVDEKVQTKESLQQGEIKDEVSKPKQTQPAIDTKRSSKIKDKRPDEKIKKNKIERKREEVAKLFKSPAEAHADIGMKVKDISSINKVSEPKVETTPEKSKPTPTRDEIMEAILGAREVFQEQTMIKNLHRTSQTLFQKIIPVIRFGMMAKEKSITKPSLKKESFHRFSDSELIERGNEKKKSFNEAREVLRQKLENNQRGMLFNNQNVIYKALDNDWTIEANNKSYDFINLDDDDDDNINLFNYEEQATKNQKDRRSSLIEYHRISLRGEQILKDLSFFHEEKIPLELSSTEKEVVKSYLDIDLPIDGRKEGSEKDFAADWQEDSRGEDLHWQAGSLGEVLQSGWLSREIEREWASHEAQRDLGSTDMQIDRQNKDNIGDLFRYESDKNLAPLSGLYFDKEGSVIQENLTDLGWRPDELKHLQAEYKTAFKMEENYEKKIEDYYKKRILKAVWNLDCNLGLLCVHPLLGSMGGRRSVIPPILPVWWHARKTTVQQNLYDPEVYSINL